MKFIVSYSCGKDSALSLHKMLEAGHTPVGLLVMVNRDMQRSWFHGVDPELLQCISDALHIPLILCESDGNDYHTRMEIGLKKGKEMGADACVFGDIDIEEHLTWCRERCEAAGLKCIHPLWHRDREENTNEILSLGYRCVIKCVRNQMLPQEYLGRVLDFDLIEDMKKRGIDICGENGEYHTVVLGGPIFRYPVLYECRKVYDFGTISAIDIGAAVV